MVTIYQCLPFDFTLLPLPYDEPLVDESTHLFFPSLVSLSSELIAYSIRACASRADFRSMQTTLLQSDGKQQSGAVSLVSGAQECSLRSSRMRRIALHGRSEREVLSLMTLDGRTSLLPHRREMRREHGGIGHRIVLMVKLDGNMTMTGFCFENLRYGLALLADYITILRDMPGLFM